MATRTTTQSRLTKKLTPVVRFREFPFGTQSDPSMRSQTRATPWPDQEQVLAYLRSGHILAVTMGAALTDYFDPAKQVEVTIDGSPVGGTTPMTDGRWFWYSGLIYFVDRYNLPLPTEFIEYARSQNWQVDGELALDCDYDFSHFK